MEYNFQEIEKNWQKYWEDNKTYQVEVNHNKPKYYVLDMFPYPSGSGLHVGHPLGYIASDIYTRFKRLKGFNVLHPMGFDAFGLPAEQYAIQTGQHPAKTTETNIKRYKEQLTKIGFAYDWSREVRTSDPEYYKWTQWAFIHMFNHWYNYKTKKAEPISELIAEFELNGNLEVHAACNEKTPKFYHGVWNGFTEKEKHDILMNYRLAYRSETMVNWCPALGPVLANDEVKEGLSVRGGHPVEQRPMLQWLLRVSAYAERLLSSLDTLSWTDSLKDMQRNWIGRSEGAELFFNVKDSNTKIQIFTTRPDTIYGATFMVIAPEHDLVDKLTIPTQERDVENYLNETKKRTERERLSEVKKVTGVFTGSFAINPFTNQEIPIWISDYVLAGYGTGAIMAVPAHDSRDYAFAKHFNLPIIEVVSGGDITNESYDAKDGKMINSELINGLDVKEAIVKINDEIERMELGKRKINYRLRDAIFSRQRYWGEPFPIYYKDGMAFPLPEDKLPLLLPEIAVFAPTEKGEPPLGRVENWKSEDGFPLELSTMPGFAGSSAYYLRYMDPKNNEALVSKEANEYWQDVDLYIGGTEHAVGHLIYSRFWNKFLFDLGYVCKDEPFKKLVNQGMIQGRSNIVYRISGILYKPESNPQKYIEILVSKDYVDISRKRNQKLNDNEAKLLNEYDQKIDLLSQKYKIIVDSNKFTELKVYIQYVKNDFLNIEELIAFDPEWNNLIRTNTVEFIKNSNDQYLCGYEVEKMSKSFKNVVNPDIIVDQYGADTLRFYEMFLGPIDQAKPWDTNGIEGVHKFLKKLWRLFQNEKGEFAVSEDEPTNEELKILHKTIKKVEEDIERFSFNTSVSAFMICVNELGTLKCNKRAILEPLTIILASFAPHITEELWRQLGHETTVADATFPKYDDKYLIENSINYPVAFNGKTRFTLELSVDFTTEQIQEAVMKSDKTEKYLEGKTPKKVIIVPKKMVNIVM